MLSVVNNCIPLLFHYLRCFDYSCLYCANLKKNTDTTARHAPYLTFFERCNDKNIKLQEYEINFLNNIVNHKTVNKKSVKETEIQRAIYLLQEQEAA